MTNTTDTLACGVSVHDLNALVDHSLGASDALPAVRVSELEAHTTTCPYCQQTLTSLRSLHSHARTLLDEESARHAEGGWLDRILDGLTIEMLPGRTIPLEEPRPGMRLDQTEGSLRALVRHRVSNDDTLVVRTNLDGDLTRHDATVRLAMTVHVRLGTPIPGLLKQLRDEARNAITSSTSLTVGAIDITVADTFGHSGVRA